MRCPSCGHENPDGVKFCGECGASLQAVATCPRCGTSNPQGTKFCHECGQRLAEPSKPTESGTLYRFLLKAASGTIMYSA